MHKTLFASNKGAHDEQPETCGLSSLITKNRRGTTPTAGNLWTSQALLFGLGPVGSLRSQTACRAGWACPGCANSEPGGLTPACLSARTWTVTADSRDRDRLLMLADSDGALSHGNLNGHVTEYNPSHDDHDGFRWCQLPVARSGRVQVVWASSLTLVLNSAAVHTCSSATLSATWHRRCSLVWPLGTAGWDCSRFGSMCPHPVNHISLFYLSSFRRQPKKI